MMTITSTDRPEFTTLHTRRTGPAVWITIDNPPVNALSVPMMRELRAVLSGLADDETVSVIVFESGNPEYFIAHVDMMIGDQMDALGELAALAPEGVNVFQAVGEMLRRQPQITIVKLAGIARGGGAEFIAAADMTFAARETTRIGQIEALMGIVPSGGGTQYLLERVGRNRALELILGADAVDADTAADYGWINRSVAAAELDEVVDGLARRIGALPDGVAVAVKRVLAPITPLEGYRREEAEWADLFRRPAAMRLIGGALDQGAQTPAGERDLEGLLRRMEQEGATDGLGGTDQG